jgi:hypothetical protein
LNVCGPARWHVTGQDRDPNQQQADADKGWRVESADSKNKTLHEAHERECSRQAECDAQQSHTGALA